jgi:ureidoacrylate peracid hydrolase
MHDTVIFPETVDLARRYTGGLHRFSEFDTSRCVHVDIDMQNAFVEPGSLAWVPEAKSLIPNINQISRAVRASGGLNVFTRWLVADPATAPWRSYFDDEVMAALHRSFSHGSSAFELSAELDVSPEDQVIDKTRFSALIPGTSPLEAILRERDAEVVIVTGTLTNMCCESTVRDAMQFGYKVIVVPDATAAPSDDIHNRSINAMAVSFSDIVETAQLLTTIDANRNRRPRRACAGRNVPCGVLSSDVTARDLVTCYGRCPLATE